MIAVTRNPLRTDPHVVNGYRIEPTTGPLDLLRDRHVVVLGDLENLEHSARDLGYHLSLTALAERLRSTPRSCVLHACLSRPADEAADCRANLQARGWKAHVNPTEKVRTWRGTEVKANADNLLLFLAGKLLSRGRADCVVLGSGDGDLVQTIAHALARHLDKPRDLFTLSLPGSTSCRLDAARNPLIKANLEIGRDCLRPLRSSAR
jgi:hypothetical protein